MATVHLFPCLKYLHFQRFDDRYESHQRRSPVRAAISISMPIPQSSAAEKPEAIILLAYARLGENTLPSTVVKHHEATSVYVSTRSL